MSDDDPQEPSSDQVDADSSEERSSAAGEPVELLVNGRARRATAGTRLSSLIDREADDELELLFAENEQEEDNEFEDDEAEDASDVQLDSASDDEGQDVARADDDFEGEKELRQQERQQLKKRKAQDFFTRPGGLKKKARLGPSKAGDILATPALRPKKKSERVSWLSTKDKAPVRASSRKQTIENKTITQLRHAAAEKRRVQQLHVMEEAAKRKESMKPKTMTQAQRMEEAARTERTNAKSLNRWEAAEKKKSEEQKAKLEALHNRQLTGPVITWWSGMARWINGKLKLVGWRNIQDAETKTHQAKQKKAETKPDTISKDQMNTVEVQDIPTIDDPKRGAVPTTSHIQNYTAQDDKEGSIQQIAPTPSHNPQGFLDGIHYYASLPEQPHGSISEEPSTAIWNNRPPLEPLKPVIPPTTPERPSSQRPISVCEHSTRNLVVLEDIDANAVRMPELQNHVLLKKRNGKPQSKPLKYFFIFTIATSPTDTGT